MSGSTRQPAQIRTRAMSDLHRRQVAPKLLEDRLGAPVDDDLDALFCASSAWRGPVTSHSLPSEQHATRISPPERQSGIDNDRCGHQVGSRVYVAMNSSSGARSWWRCSENYSGRRLSRTYDRHRTSILLKRCRSRDDLKRVRGSPIPRSAKSCRGRAPRRYLRTRGASIRFGREGRLVFVGGDTKRISNPCDAAAAKAKKYPGGDHHSDNLND
jgi:hypothetical protein